MAVKIDSKIVSYKVVENEQKPANPAGTAAQATAASGVQVQETNVIQMHESFQRPERLVGSTYKVKTPMSEHAMYITINDVILNEGTEHEVRRPFEVFINSKNMEHFQWVVALTRLISAIFRKGGDATFLAEELKAVFDPRGGYFKKGGVFMPSIVAEIGHAIEDHMKHIGLIEQKLDDHQQQYLEQKRRELVGDTPVKKTEGAAQDEAAGASFPASASLCMKCHVKAVVMMDNCMTCLNCADSKCN
jgi:hypothetical protein